ncbi:MAG: type II toxin-antitoxin system prevent-host-death family antitoxin [Candidatus Desulfofervidus auxilii]|nr:type II toxin-antitoxin system prevent-host-death family antitoxin [Candidatus Desulfofervidus auxilii]
MDFVTVKELRQKTKAILQRVKEGEQIIVTHRGKPIAIVSPFNVESLKNESLRPFEEAWKDISSTLEKKEPQFSNWQKAIDYSRKKI